MAEKNKQHISMLPDPIFPTVNYTWKNNKLAVSYPIFASNVDSGQQAFNPDRIQDIHLKGGVWSAISLLTNTDFPSYNVEVYFHIEDLVWDICKPLLDKYKVPDQYIRKITMPKPHPIDGIWNPQFGKKYMCLFDDEIDTDTWLVHDTDAFWCSTQSIMFLYEMFTGEAMRGKVATWHARMTCHKDKSYAHVVWGERFGSGLNFDREGDIEQQEQEAYDKVGLKFNVQNGQYYRIRGSIFTQFVLLPKEHAIVPFLKEHCVNSYQDEYLLSMWQSMHGGIIPLDQIMVIPMYGTESEYLNRDKSINYYIAHIRPDKFNYEKGQQHVDKYFPEFFADLSRCAPKSLINQNPVEKPKSDIGLTFNQQSKVNPVNNLQLRDNPKRLRLHHLVPQYAVTNEEHTCAFVQKVRKGSKMLTKLGHTNYHYGHEKSDVVCTKHITVTNDEILRKSYGEDWHKQLLAFDGQKDHAFQEYNKNCEMELRNHCQVGDFVLAWGGHMHYNLCQSISDLPVHIVEPGIGYPDVFAQYKVFESSAWLHFQRGKAHAASDLRERYPKINEVQQYNRWDVRSLYDPDYNTTVIPNFFDPDEFDYDDEKDNYMLFLGRVQHCKGVDIAVELSKATGIPLTIAGPGNVNEIGIDIPDNTTVIGHADFDVRRRLYAKARVVVCPSRYIEPFLGVPIEAGLSGTPFIVPNYGAPREYCVQGKNGYIFNNFEQMVWAVNNIDSISPKDCYELAWRFSLDRISLMYHEYFMNLRRSLTAGNDFYYPNEDRKDLDLTVDYLEAIQVQPKIKEIQQNLDYEVS